MTPTFEAKAHLSNLEVEAVTELVNAAARLDGVRPLSEHVELHLRLGGDEGSCHLLARDGEEIVGYAHLDGTDEVAGPSAEVAVHPSARRQGIARRLVTELVERSSPARLRLWAHGEQTPAVALATSMGFERDRTLWQLRRSLYAPLPHLSWPAGFELRTFEPGSDESAWLELNAIAFADLPDQGTWTITDLQQRMSEPWFDPAGFLIAQDAAGLAGFHWTKVHGSPNPHHDHPHELLGEVYVVGARPDLKGRGLGRALTVAGLIHLRERGLAQAMLYVDATNTRAIRLYESLGFTRWDSDVLFRQPGNPTSVDASGILGG